MLENLRRMLRIARPGSAGKDSPHRPVPPHLEPEAGLVGGLCFCTLAPELGDEAAVVTEGLEKGEPRLQVQMKVHNTSALWMTDRAYPLLHEDWVLHLMVSIDAPPGYVHDAALRRPDPPDSAGSGPPMPDPFALLAAVPVADPAGWPEPIPPAERLWPTTDPGR